MRDGSIPEPAGLKREVSLKLTVIARQMRNRFDQSVAKLGVTRSYWTLFAVVGRYPGSTQRTIAEALEITEASAGRLVDKLCAEGMLERRPKEEDRRAYAVHMTDKASDLMSTLSTVARANEEKAFSGLSETQIEQLNGLLDIVYQNVSLPKDRPDPFFRTRDGK